MTRDVHWYVTVDYQQIASDNIANQIHGFTIDYGKLILSNVINHTPNIHVNIVIQKSNHWVVIPYKTKIRYNYGSQPSHSVSGIWRLYHIQSVFTVDDIEDHAWRKTWGGCTLPHMGYIIYTLWVSAALFKGEISGQFWSQGKGKFWPFWSLKCLYKWQQCFWLAVVFY